MTASLESYAEAPEIEKILNDNILSAIESDEPLTENSEGVATLAAAVETAANPVQSVPPLPTAALEISNRSYTFGENPFGWTTLEFVFESGRETAQVMLNEVPVQIGLDNIYRSSETAPGYEMLLRGLWTDEQTFVIDYPYSLAGIMALGELGESEFRFTFMGDKLKVTAEQLVFGGEPITVEGSR